MTQKKMAGRDVSINIKQGKKFALEQAMKAQGGVEV